MKKYLLVLSLAALCSACQQQQWSGLPNFAGRPQNDTNLTASVQAALDNSGQFANAPITIETRHREVRLSGYVKTIRQSDVAAELAGRTPGVTKVTNHLIVRK